MGERHHQGGQPRAGQQRPAPAEAVHRDLGGRHEQELPDRAARRDDARGRAPASGRHHRHDRAEHDDEGDAGHGQPEQEAEGDGEAKGRRHEGRQREAEGVEEATACGDAAGPVSVRQRPDEGLGEPEDQVLHSHGEAEALAPDAEIQLHRPHEQAEPLAEAQGDRHDDRAAGERDPGRGPAEKRRGGHGRGSGKAGRDNSHRRMEVPS